MTLRSLALLPIALLLTGCALTTTSTPSAAKGLSLRGSLHGGQQPIVGAHVYLMAADATAYGNPSQSLLDPVATGQSDSVGAYVASAADGGWNISGDYTCTPNQQVYLYALGGDPGAGVNSASGLLAVLGNCPSSGTFMSSVPYVTMNEVSTVAAAYAMAPYAADATHVASSGSALAQTGIANAFANASNLADLGSGQPLATTPAGTGTVPQATLNLMANILAACVNSTGPSSAQCATLLGEATSDGTSGGTAATDTASAMINIVHHPGANVADLFNLPPAIAPFSPSVSAQPNDFTLAIAYDNLPGLSHPVSVAVDASGNIWVANMGSSSVAAISSLGVPLTGSPFSGNGVSQPTQLAIDPSNNIWVANAGGNSVSLFDNTGTAISGSPISGGGLDGPSSIAVGDGGQVWAGSAADNTLTLIATSGTPSISAITTGGLDQPWAIAVDPSQNTWVLNRGTNSVSLFDSTGTSLLSSPITGDGLNFPWAIAIDGSGNAWIANLVGNSLTVLDPTGTPVSGSPFLSIGAPFAIAFDGGGNAWVANGVGAKVTEVSSTGGTIPGSPFTEASIQNASAIAVDGSGSVWVAGQTNTLTQIIGTALPAVTPIAAAVNSGTTGTRP